MNNLSGNNINNKNIRHLKIKFCVDNVCFENHGMPNVSCMLKIPKNLHNIHSYILNS